MSNSASTAGRRLRLGMIGGGPGAFIGNVHRMAARLDNEYELVCGSFSADPAKSAAMGRDLYLDPSRVYNTWEELIAQEAKLPADQRMDVLSVVTPNHLHFGPSMAALQAGFHVISDKPITFDSGQALQIVDAVEQSGLVFGLTHNYTGYPMVKQARAMVAAGEFGQIRRIIVEYPQGWLAEKLEDTGQKQAAWRSDPLRSGIAGAIGDIGTHAENLASYVTGRTLQRVLAEAVVTVEGRLLDDDATVLMHFDDNVRGLLYCSQINAGEENGLRLRVYGEKGGLDWHQMEPNTLRITKHQGLATLYRTGVGELHALSQAATRIPAGHPEAFIEAFANVYRGVAQAIRIHHGEEIAAETRLDFPGVHEGLSGMHFIEAVIESSNKGNVWIDLPDSRRS